MIYFLYCDFAPSLDRIAIHQADDLHSLLSGAITLQSARGIHVLGQMPDSGPHGTRDHLDIMFGHLIDSLFYVPNTPLLDFILAETTPVDRPGREFLVRLCETREIEDDLIPFGVREQDGGDGLTWKRFGDLTDRERREFLGRLGAQMDDARRETLKIEDFLAKNFSDEEIAKAKAKLDGPLPDLD